MFFQPPKLGILEIVNPSLWHLRVAKLWAATNVSTLPRPKVRRRTSKVSCWKQMASACLPCHQYNSLWSKINALCIHFTQEEEHLDDSYIFLILRGVCSRCCRPLLYLFLVPACVRQLPDCWWCTGRPDVQVPTTVAETPAFCEPPGGVKNDGRGLEPTCVVFT